MTNLKPCPFCGEEEAITIVGSKSPFKRHKEFYCWCVNCNLCGPKKGSMDKAEVFWNALPRKEETK